MISRTRSRGATSGYQTIVVPGFLDDAGQAYVLEYASKQETDEPGIVTVRDVVGATAGPLSVAYRVTEARAGRYGLDGDDLLEDGAGRAIRVFEGLVLRIPAERVLSIGLTVADLDAVTAVTAPVFRKLWTAGTPIDAELSTPFQVGGAPVGGAPASLCLPVQIAEPYTVPGRTTRPRPYLSWVTISSSSYCSTGGGAGGGAGGAGGTVGVGAGDGIVVCSQGMSAFAIPEGRKRIASIS